MTILPKYYCPTCGEFKNRLQVRYRDDTRVYWFECKWCHEPVRLTRDAIEEVLNIHQEYSGE